jgi:glutamyl-tRNA synthetase
MYLYQLLGLTAPEFIHLPLLLTADGRRLSKRNADAGLDDLQPRYTAEEIIGKLAYLAGCNPTAEPRSAESLIGEFDWNKVPKEDIRIPEGLF